VLGITRRPRLVRALRSSGLYVPLRLAYDGFPSQERLRWAELRGFKSREGRILRRVRGNRAGPLILFPLMSTPGLYRLRVTGMLAKALEVRGCRPLFVVDRHDIWHEEYLRAFGFHDFVYYDDLLPGREQVESKAASMLRDCNSVEDVLALTYEGIDVGMHAAGRTVNRLQQGTLDLESQETRAELSWCLANSLASTVAFHRLVGSLHPDKLLTSTHDLTPWVEFYNGALLRGTDTLFWVPARMSGALLFRRYRYDDRYEPFFGLADETWESVERMPWTRDDANALLAELRESYASETWFQQKRTLTGKATKSPDQIRAELRLDPEKKNAFVFSHLLFDAPFWAGESLFRDYGEWLVETMKAAAENTNVNWIVKLHPDNLHRRAQALGRYRLEDLQEYSLLKRLFPSLPEHFRLLTPDSNTSTDSLFDFADYALTVRGSVGLEFPCCGVPTLTAAAGGYSGRGFTIDSKTHDEYRARIGRIETIPRLSAGQVALAQRFSYGVFQMKPVPFASFEADLLPDEQWDRGWTSHSFDLRVTSATELRRAADLAWFADWALNSDARDLLGPAAQSRLQADGPRPVALAG